MSFMSEISDDVFAVDTAAADRVQKDEVLGYGDGSELTVLGGVAEAERKVDALRPDSAADADFGALEDVVDRDDSITTDVSVPQSIGEFDDGGTVTPSAVEDAGFGDSEYGAQAARRVGTAEPAEEAIQGSNRLADGQLEAREMQVPATEAAEREETDAAPAGVEDRGAPRAALGDEVVVVVESGSLSESVDDKREVQGGEDPEAADGTASEPANEDRVTLEGAGVGDTAETAEAGGDGADRELPPTGGGDGGKGNGGGDSLGEDPDPEKPDPDKAEDDDQSDESDEAGDRDGEQETSDRIDMDELNELIRRGKVTTSRHPTLPLTICNYTALRPIKEEEWTPLLEQCRGLIIDDEGKIVSRPFPRMHEVRGAEDLPPGEFDAYEKLDGSMGVQYWDGDQPQIATRGRFEGRQITQANQMLAEYQDYPFDRNNTYVWEIIYPENRLVVDYGDQRSITLLGVIETETGRELPLPDQSEVPFPVIKRYEGFESAEQLRAAEEGNAEGYVVRMKDTGQRIKVKFESYDWLDSERRGMLPQRVWSRFRDGMTAQDIVGSVPGAVQGHISEIASDMQRQYTEAEGMIRASVSDRSIQLTNRQQEIRSMMRNGRPYERLLWNSLRPERPARRIAPQSDI